MYLICSSLNFICSSLNFESLQRTFLNINALIISLLTVM